MNFTINLNAPAGPADGLLFDPTATGINTALFTNHQTGIYSFFISTLSDNIFDNLLDEDDGFPAINIASEMAWEGASIDTTFDAPGEPFDGAELRPRGEMVIPSPSALAVLMLGGLLARRRRRTR